jgi:peptide/nickel transport system substrate-binding protein
VKNKILWFGFSSLMVAAMLLASCSAATTSTTTTKAMTTTTTSTAIVTQVTTSTVSTSKLTTVTAAHWWDSLGKPEYGGEIVLRANRTMNGFDPCISTGTFTIYSAWLERLHADDWALDPAVFDYSISFRPYQYVKGWLGETWEFTDANTYVVHLHQGIHWQDLPPANGREFVADDVVFHYDRVLGTGHGFTKPAPLNNITPFKDLVSVTAPDKYTVVFKWKTANAESIMETLQGNDALQHLENPEAVRQWGDLLDWHHAIGTGPFILKDFVPGSSATLVKNPNYWGYDERYPQNKLPYVDSFKLLEIIDTTTALAAMRTGKIDVMDGLSVQQDKDMLKTNPKLVEITIPSITGLTIDPKYGTAPFTDIRVRKAMQMAIDLPTIAKSFYSGTVDPRPLALTSYYVKGWGYPYEDWPQDLKDEYAYNPTAAKQLLSAAGFPNGFKTNTVVDATFDMDLLQIVKSYLMAVGVDMEIRILDSSSWTTFVQTNRKQDQMATRSGSLGITYEPLRQVLKFQTGYSSNIPNVSDPVYDAFVTKANASTSADDIKKILRDVNEYVVRQHYVISLLQPKLFSLNQPWLKGYNGQYFGVSGPNVGILLLGFYPARFWVDKNMKKSMGY